ncbi:MAG: hypothetical protein CL678_16030 [Bdellovibrionaceae bacterium]|nr:hypothetical protein [Pseudobdellovibrionaceae bacterium]|tara:strand:+ start:147 stop:356 length:210 start_codon:yes stop_codon:yes gene_type:complete
MSIEILETDDAVEQLQDVFQTWQGEIPSAGELVAFVEALETNGLGLVVVEESPSVESDDDADEETVEDD